MKQDRGELTKRIEKKSRELMGYTITTNELRLMVYVQYRIVNEKSLERAHMGDDDREILDKWQKAGYVNRNAFISMTITKKFWDIICEIIFLGYVDIN